MIVGPSGSGKQALIDAVLAARPDIGRAPLIVSAQNSNNTCVVGSVSPDRFLHYKRRDMFALQWDSDGFRYGLTHDAAKKLRDGESLILSSDSSIIDDAKALYPNVQVIYITARMDVLRRRLASMAFGTDTEIDMHLAQSARMRPRKQDFVTVDTSDSIAAGAKALMDAIPVTS
jgi:ribose 1,5-bisphosphokinase